MSMFFTAISAFGQVAAGMGAQKEAELNAFNVQTEKKLNQVQAAQQARARREEYDLATAANIATFAAMGRDIGADRSVEAFLQRQQEIVGEDIGRIAQQTRAEDLAADMRSLAEKRRGRNAMYTSLFNAAGTIGEGLQQASRTKTD